MSRSFDFFSGVPIGTIISVMGTHAPNGYLKCDGSELNIAEYPDLANYFEQEFGTKNNFGGDGVDTFAVPDLRGEFLRGTGTNSHANQGSGANVGVHQNSTEHPYMWERFDSNRNGKLAIIPLPGKRVASTDSALFRYADKILNTKNVDPNVNTYDVDWFTPSSKEQDYSISSGTGIPTTFVSRPTNTSVLYCIKYLGYNGEVDES